MQLRKENARLRHYNQTVILIVNSLAQHTLIDSHCIAQQLSNHPIEGSV